MVPATEERVRAETVAAFPRLWPARPAHRRLVHEFRLASGAGDAAWLMRLLHPDIAVVVDGGDEQHPTIRMVRGVAEAVPLLLHGLANGAEVVVEERSVNGQAGLILRRGDQTVANVNVDSSGHLINAVWVALNPTTLRHWNGTSAYEAG